MGEPTKKVGLLFDWFDRNVIDGLVRAVAHLAELVAAGSTWTEKHVIYGGINWSDTATILPPASAATAERDGASLCRHHCGRLFLLAAIIQLIMQL